ncbi:MAG TPA: RNA polymerase sigma factor [Rhodanobacteraceae bacterium]|jgi:RNA polymerase sigma-70 factor (ECF subfamily)|nr:RNA polymerase sigma factor [Rhodanobacteraceae bacterium]
MSQALAIDYATLGDAELVAHARRGHREAFRQIMRRGNQRLFRVARGVLNDDDEAEDAVQEAWTIAFAKLDGFRGEASLLTWMTRIVLNECYGRLRRRKPTVGIDQIEAAQQLGDGRVLMFPHRYGSEDPAADASRAQMRGLLERAIAALPEPFRVVFVMRDIEECSIEETASALDIRAETVKTRLHRARRLLRTALHDNLANALNDAFPFLGPRCDRMIETVLARLPLSNPSGESP